MTYLLATLLSLITRVNIGADTSFSNRQILYSEKNENLETHEVTNTMIRDTNSFSLLMYGDTVYEGLFSDMDSLQFHYPYIPKRSNDMIYYYTLDTIPRMTPRFSLHKNEKVWIRDIDGSWPNFFVDTNRAYTYTTYSGKDTMLKLLDMERDCYIFESTLGIFVNESVESKYYIDKKSLIPLIKEYKYKQFNKLITQYVSGTRRLPIIKPQFEGIDYYNDLPWPPGHSPMDIKAYRERAFSRMGFDNPRRTDFQGAISDFDRVLKADKMDTTAYLTRGIAKAYLKDYMGAIADYSIVIDIDPKYYLAYSNRGLAKSDLKDYAGSISDCDKAIAINPKLEVAFVVRAYAKYHIKDYQGAIADANKAIEMDSMDIGCYGIRAASKIKTKDYHGALADCNKALELLPWASDLCYTRADAKYSLADYAGAIADCDKYIEGTPDDAEAYSLRGKAKIASGQIDSGCQDLKKALELGDQDVQDEIKKHCQK